MQQVVDLDYTNLFLKMKRILKKFCRKIEIKDIYGGFILLGGLYLIAIGINHLVSGMMIMVTTYYFRKRLE